MVITDDLKNSIKAGAVTGLVIGWLISGPGYVSFLDPGTAAPYLLFFGLGLVISFVLLQFKKIAAYFVRLRWYFISGLITFIMILQLIINDGVFLGASVFILGMAVFYLLFRVANILLAHHEPIYLVGAMLLVANLIYSANELYLSLFPGHQNWLSLGLSFSTFLFGGATNHPSENLPLPSFALKSSLSLKMPDHQQTFNNLLLLCFCLLALFLVYTGGTLYYFQLTLLDESNYSIFARVYILYLLSLIFFALFIRRFKSSYVLGYCISILGSAVAMGIATEGKTILSIISLSLFSVSAAGIDIFIILVLVALSRQTKTSIYILSGLILYWLIVELSTYAGVYASSSLLLNSKLLSAVIIVFILLCLPLLLNRKLIFLPERSKLSSAANQHLEVQAAVTREAKMMLELTASEKRVYELICTGLSNVDIAQSLDISQNTVKFHVKNILRKAEVKNKYQLLALVNLSHVQFKDGGFKN